MVAMQICIKHIIKIKNIKGLIIFYNPIQMRLRRIIPNLIDTDLRMIIKNLKIKLIKIFTILQA